MGDGHHPLISAAPNPLVDIHTNVYPEKYTLTSGYLDIELLCNTYCQKTMESMTGQMTGPRIRLSMAEAAYIPESGDSVQGLVLKKVTCRGGLPFE